MKRYKQYAIPALLTLTVLATLFFLVSGVVGASPSPEGRSPVRGHLIPSLQGHSPTGAPNGQQMLHLTISLNLADPAGLHALINAQNDKHSPLYHQYITPQQFAARFAPSQASVDSVVSFLRSQGLTVKSVSANRLIIKADGTVATVEQAFNVHISNYTLKGRTVYAPSNEPSVPSSLSRLILNIGGLDNASTPHRISSLVPKKAPMPNTGPGGGYTPSELRKAYDMNSLLSVADGTGQTVAIAELDGYIPSDINTYLSHYGLGSPKYSNVLLDGATGAPDEDQGGAIEVELDMEVMSAIAPGAAQKIYIAPNTDQGFLDIFNQIVLDNTAKVTSNSWGLCEPLTGTATMQAFDDVFAQGAAQGQAFFSASGDAGAFDCEPFEDGLAVDFPASDPNVVGVGGTTLTTGTGGTYKSETAWSNTTFGEGSGGGLSSFFPQPSYQTGPGVTNSFSNGMREVPDVSADADPNTGYSEFCTDPSVFGCEGLGWFEIGGTSAAAPLWAGIVTDLNEYLAHNSKPTLGSASEPLYWLFNTTHPFAAYHDIKTGNNLFYPATSGYDLATGAGTPDVWNIARDFAAAAPAVTPNPLYLVTTPGVNPASQIVTISNSGYTPYHWSLGALPAWLSANVSSGTIAPNGSTQVTLSFSLESASPPYTATLLVNDTDGIIPALSLPVTVVAANVSKTWYFAEGFTGGSFSEYLTLANPNNVSTNVTVQYLIQGASPLPKQYGVPAHSRVTIKVNNEVGANKAVSMVVTSDQPIIAERPMYFTFRSSLWGITIPGGSDVLGATSLGQDFDFGYLDTTTNHDTYLTILNPNGNPMDVQVSYFPKAGGAPLVRTHSVDANSRGTIYVDSAQEDLPRGTYSALVHLSLPGLVERPMYLKDGTTGFTGSADVVGVTQPLTSWDFAEGFTSATFKERYIVSNPSTTDTATGSITFFLPSGAPQTTNFTLAPGQQQIINVGVTGNNSAHVQADHAILAERFMSFKFGGTIPGATDVLGAAAPGYLFYFAEGFTGTGFSEYLTIENPDAQTAVVQVTFLPANGGTPQVRVYSIAPHSRFTVNTATVMAGQSFSMVVQSNVAMVAERPMYFTFGSTQTGGSDVVGYQP